MKAQERHELRENDLAGWLQYGLWNFLRQNGSYILLVVALCFLGYQIYNLVQQRRENARLQAWSEYSELAHRDDVFENIIRAGSALNNPANTSDPKKREQAAKEMEDALALAKSRPNRLREIIDAHQIPSLKAACYLSLADFYREMLLMPELMNDMKLNRGEALEKEAEAYRGALAAMPDDVMISAQAQLGIAAALEDQGDWDKAKDVYKILTDKSGKYAQTAWSKLAEERADQLENRRSAPRLAAMIPLPTAPRPEAPALNSGLGLESILGPTSRPSLFSPLGSGSGLGNVPLTTQPASTPGGLGNPFGLTPLGPPATKP